MRIYIPLLAGVLLCACSHTDERTEQPKSVYIASPEVTDDSRVLTFTGIVEEDDNISLGFKTPGQIKRILVKEGDHVRNGQLLAVLDDEDYRLGVEALQIQYDQVKEEVERASRLFEKKSMTANDYEKATAGLKQLAVQLQANKNKLAYTRLYAPAAGIIETVNFAPAEMVDAGTPVFTMIGSGAMEVTCDITARAYRDRGQISRISCTPTNGTDIPVELKLLSIVPKADSNQLYRMRLGTAGSDQRLLTPGMNVTVRVALSGDESESLAVPASSIFRKGNDTYVWVLQPDTTVTARKVTLKGTLRGSMADLEDGLSASEHIVRAGVAMLHEGEKVRVIEKASESNVGELL